MKVAIYCRLSEEDKNKSNQSDDSNSIKNQKTMLLEYAMTQGWEVYNIYSDDDYAGADRNRPEFKRLIEDAKKRLFDIVLCKTQSRFTRELELVEKYIHGLFPALGIRFVSIVDNADTANKGNKKSRQINGLVNEWYLEDMSENIKSVLVSRRKNGFHIGAFALYGYKKDPHLKGHLIIDEEAATVVKDVFLLFTQGYGKSAIARILNDRGIPNPTEYKRQKGLRYKAPERKNSTLWRYSAIASMLENEIYIGNMVQGKYGSVSYKTKQNKPRPKEEWFRVEGTHEPIIERELWDRVQEILKEKSKPFGGGKIGIFAGKVRCAGCGYVMRSSKNRDRHYLKCASKAIARDSCEGAFVSVALLEEVVLSELRRLSELYLNRDELKNRIEIYDTEQAQIDKLESEVLRQKKKVEEYSKALSDLYMDKAKGVITTEDFIMISKNLSQEKVLSEELLRKNLERIEKLRTGIREEDARVELVKRYTNIEHLTRGMVEILIDYIIVGRRRKGEKYPPIEIHWNF